MWPGEAVRDAVRQLLPINHVLGAEHNFIVKGTFKTGRRRIPRTEDRRITIARRTKTQYARLALWVGSRVHLM